uniref:U2 snRNP-associated SURP motif-containing protein n=1 Tax=Panagrolaimus sp. JU765 TaxID=591449 RepID=A0AC34QMV4_9BILA
MDRLKKRREEEQKLAEVLQDFKETFESTKPTSVAFVRGEVVNADKNFVPTPVSLKPVPVVPAKPVVFQDAVKKAAETAQRLLAQVGTSKVSISLHSSVLQKPKISESPLNVAPPVNRPPKPGKPETKPKVSNLEMFMAELKTIQEQREERKSEREKELQASGLSGEELDRMKAVLTNPYLDSGYSEFSENLETTNLYISFLPLDTTLEDLYDTFGTFGPLASARILHPRAGDQRQHLFAFVAYMSRKDAERALRTMNGSELNGNEIKVSWGKVVEIPSVPFYVPPALAAMALPDSPTGLPFNAKPRKSDLDNYLAKHGHLPELTHIFTEHDPRKADYTKMLRNAIVRVVIPTDRTLLKLIHRTIEYVVREGPQFEAAIMTREMKNPAFRFLYENCQPMHTYYRWKLFSILQGDDPYNWRTERFRMFDEGSWWEPPPYDLGKEMLPQLYYTAYKPKAKGSFHRKRQLAEADRERTEAEKAKRRRGALSDDDRDFLEQMLRNLTPKRRHVGLAMCWCLRRAKSAKEIVECIVEALMIPETPLYKKLGRFYLLSDILANCEVIGPEIAHYRQHIESKLELIFSEFNSVVKKIPTRVNQTQFRSRIASCIQMWSENTIYTRQDLIRLQNVFYGIKDTNKRSDSPETRRNDSETEPSDSETEEYESRNGSQGKSSLNFKANDEWIQVDPSKEKAIAANKWERDDYDYHREDRYAATVSRNASHSASKNSFGGIAIKLGNNSRSEIASASGKTSDEKRRILRDIETKVVLFQEELEELRDPFMEEKVDQYREELLQKADLIAFAESDRANRSSHRDTRNYDNRIKSNGVSKWSSSTYR